MDDVTFTLVSDRFPTRDQVGKLASRLGIVDAAGKANPDADQRLEIAAIAANIGLSLAIGTSENTLNGLITAFREFITPTPWPPAPAPTAIAGGDPTAAPIPDVGSTPPPIG